MKFPSTNAYIMDNIIVNVAQMNTMSLGLNTKLSINILKWYLKKIIHDGMFVCIVQGYWLFDIICVCVCVRVCVTVHHTRQCVCMRLIRRSLATIKYYVAVCLIKQI